LADREKAIPSEEPKQAMKIPGGQHFLLVGTTLYLNRGCEAIVRGTMTVLRRSFGDGIRVTAASAGTPSLVRAQNPVEPDRAIRHIPLRYGRFSIPWALDQAGKRLRLPAAAEQWTLGGAVKDACVALAVGGDNYSLDYGLPDEFMKADRFLFASGVPVVLWGASIGPFDADTKFEKEMLDHLKRMRGIFVRESASARYLESQGFSTVRRVADPAFVMEPAEPSEDKIGMKVSEGAAGINFSPHMAAYVSGGDLDAWRGMCAETVIQVLRQSGRDVLLVPHVFHATPLNNDHGFLESVSAAVRQKTGRSVPVLGGSLSAREIKWAIGRCAVFAGCRTHSTIAALSSGVPTLSLAYSRKARGLNQDIFGSQEYCIEPSEASADRISQGLLRLVSESSAIRGRLGEVLPRIRARAFAAGEYLGECLRTNPVEV
jgi:colanic acid/amylovoran biosynthesis protein